VQQAEDGKVGEHRRPLVDPVTGTSGVDIEQTTHASTVDQDLALVEVTVYGHRRMLTCLCARIAAEQFVQANSFVREAAGYHVCVMVCATGVITAHLVLGQFSRQLIEQPLQGAGARQRNRRAAERAA
jgi:hypothetical protein